MPKEAKNELKAPKTTFSIIETLKEVDGAGITKLATDLDLPKSTVQTHVNTLRELGYVVRDEEERGYRLSFSFLELGGYKRSQMELFKTAKPEVDRLAEETGEWSNLFVEENRKSVCLYWAAGNESVNLDTYVGRPESLHCTAGGKAMLAHFAQEKRDELISELTLDRKTESTITEVDELEDELASVRDRGFAYDHEERLSNVRCVAAPIFDNRTNRTIGGVSISGPSSRMAGDLFKEELPDLVMKAANVIEINLSYS